MNIRRLTPDSAAVYRALRLRAFRDHPEAFTISYEEYEAMPLADTEKRMAGTNPKIWGAFDNDALCGYVGLERETRAKCCHKGTLVGMYVAPENAGRGVGRALVDALLEEARHDGIELVVLTVTEGNSAAAKMYERCGFRSFGIEPRAIKVADRAYGKNHMYLDLITPS